LSREYSQQGTGLYELFGRRQSPQGFEDYPLPVPGIRQQRRSKIEFAMKTQGQIEAAICDSMARFEQEYMGRGPKDIRCHLIDDLLVVRLKGVLTAAEQHLVKTLRPEKGRDLLKQVRTHLIETARPVMEAMVEEVTGIKVLSLHHDISTATGEEVVLFTLASSPLFRESKR
jgi:uncharacterized protein YbcI